MKSAQEAATKIKAKKYTGISFFNFCTLAIVAYLKCQTQDGVDLLQSSHTMKRSAPVLFFWPLFWKTAFLSLLFAGAMLFVTALIGLLWGFVQFRHFLSAALVSQTNFLQQVKIGWQTQPANDQGHENLLILGTDSLAGRGDVPPLTDTMMLVSINLNQGTIHTLPLPRDLWSEAYHTKINALYAYGHNRTPDQPSQFPTTVISELTGIPIHHTLVLSLDQLKTLIDLVGGVTITVDKGFTDPLFPREGVDIATEHDPAVLYKTVTFESGSQTLSGDRALEYIRSRHSEDEQGHDLARGERQQQVIAALLSTLTNYKMFLTHPKLAGQLYAFYTENFDQALPISELVGTLKALLPHRQNIAFTSHELTTIDNDPVNGVIDNPPPLARYQNQWVYLITNEAKFQSTIQNDLYN